MGSLTFFTQYGDTPICLDQYNGHNEDFWAGTVATVQGYGYTEKKERGKLLEVNVTVISNEDCTERLKYNASRNAATRKAVKAVPRGIIGRGLLCTQGDRFGQYVKSSCEGDSGGPLKTLDPSNEKRETLIGVVSGGRGCGTGIPPWYTRLSFHARWFNCIIDKTTQFLNEGRSDHKRGFTQKKVEDYCRGEVRPDPACVIREHILDEAEEKLVYC